MKLSRCYTLLRVFSFFGLLACFFFRPEVMDGYNVACLFYIFFVLILFRIETDGKDEKYLFGAACIIGLLAAEIGILCSVNFWFLPLLSAIAVACYFIGYCYHYALPIDFRTIGFQSLLFLADIYLVFAIIKEGIKNLLLIFE